MINRVLSINAEFDESFICGKAHHLPFGTRKRTSSTVELIHIIICELIHTNIYGPFTQSMSVFTILF